MMTKKDKYEKFFSFIETKLNDEEENEETENGKYKKTLFSSPHFKDNEDL